MHSIHQFENKMLTADLMKGFILCPDTTKEAMLNADTAGIFGKIRQSSFNSGKF